MNLFTHYMPLRIGYCVSGSDMNDLVTIAKLSSIVSGGMVNPIINVDDPGAQNIVKVFAVDILLPISSSPKIEQFLKEHQHLRSWQLDHQGVWADASGNTGKASTKYLTVLDTIWALSNLADRSSNKILQPVWGQDDPLKVLFAVEYGMFDSDGSLYDLPKTVPGAFYERTLAISSDLPRDPALIRNITPIESSLIGIRSFTNRGYDTRDGLYLGKLQFDDLVDFWNLRASGHDMVFVPYESLDKVATISQIFSKNAKEKSKEDRFHNGISLWRSGSLGLDNSRAMEVLEKLGIEKGLTMLHNASSPITWNGLNEHPIELKLSEKQIVASVDHTKYDTDQVNFQLPTLPTDGDDFYKHRRQHLAMHIRPLTEFAYEDSTLKLPNLPDLNNWYSHKIAFASDDVRVKEDGLVIVVDTYDASKSLYPISNDEIIKKLFERAGIKAEDSQAGLITKKVIEQMGGLEGCRVFKIPGVRKLIRSLGQNDLIIRSTAKQIIRDIDPETDVSSFVAHQDLHIQARTRPVLTPDETFDYMLRLGMFQAGLKLTCPSCQLKPWLAIDKLHINAKCEYCGASVEIISQLKDRDWHFRKSGLFGADNNQEGAIPVILALHLMSHLSSSDQFSHTTALKLDAPSEGLDCETDLVVLGRSRSVMGEDHLAIAIGEMKSNSDTINDNDIANLMDTKRMLDKSGLKTYLVFGKTASFTHDEIERFKQLSESDVDLILFTDQELNHYNLSAYYHTLDDLPQSYAHTFDDLAANSKHLYLR